MDARQTLLFLLCVGLSVGHPVVVVGQENETSTGAYSSSGDVDVLYEHLSDVGIGDDFELLTNLHPLVVDAQEMSDDNWLQLLTNRLQHHGIVSDVIDTVPASVINIDYSPHDDEVEDPADHRDYHACPHLGNQLDPAQTRFQPKQLNFPINASKSEDRGDSGKNYENSYEALPVLHTLVAIDPDVPSRQNSRYSEFLHWLVVNIPNDDIERGDILAEYVGPLPSEGAESHRFIFLVYRQHGLIDTSRLPRAGLCDWPQRARFSVRKFGQLHNLGQPTAVNFFLTQFDRSVPQTIARCYHQIQTA